MAITLSYYPGPLLWSKNPISFQLSYSLFTPGWRLQVQFVDSKNGNTIADMTYPITDSSGILYLNNCQEMLDYYLSYQYPYYLSQSTGEKTQEIFPNSCKFHLRYRPVNGTQVFAWIDSTRHFRIVKGGIGDLAIYREIDANMTNPYQRSVSLPRGNNFLSWIPQGSLNPQSGRSMTPDEYGWLLFMNDFPGVLYHQYTVWYLDGTIQKFARGLDHYVYPNWSEIGRCWFIPIGIKQAKLDPNNKGVWFWKVYVFDYVTNTLVCSYQINADNRKWYNTVNLYYRNSFGGIDNILLRGVVKINEGEFQKKEFQQSRDAFSYSGSNQYYDSSIRLKFKGNTGFISKDHKTALADLFNTTWCGLLINGTWIPMRVPPQKMEPVSTEDELHSYSIEFETASTFTSYPKQLTSIIP